MIRAWALEHFGHPRRVEEWRYPSGTLVSIWSTEDASSVRLIYEGQLLSSGAKARDVAENVHTIRRQLHPQLRHFWQRNYDRIASWEMPTGFGGGLAGRVPYGGDQERAKGLAIIGQHYERCQRGFVPLISRWFGFLCSLEVLFLRQEEPGGLVHHGDIDNRMNTLFDGLRLPTDCAQDWTQEENPFYCLLDDDALITQVKITTDRLLKPMPNKGDVVLLLDIHVTLAENPW